MVSKECNRGQHGQCIGHGCECPCHSQYLCVPLAAAPDGRHADWQRVDWSEPK